VYWTNIIFGEDRNREYDFGWWCDLTNMVLTVAQN
jgi:hypothetical protein